MTTNPLFRLTRTIGSSTLATPWHQLDTALERWAMIGRPRQLAEGWGVEALDAPDATPRRIEGPSLAWWSDNLARWHDQRAAALARELMPCPAPAPSVERIAPNCREVALPGDPLTGDMATELFVVKLDGGRPQWGWAITRELLVPGSSWRPAPANTAEALLYFRDFVTPDDPDANDPDDPDLFLAVMRPLVRGYTGERAETLGIKHGDEWLDVHLSAFLLAARVWPALDDPEPVVGALAKWPAVRALGLMWRAWLERDKALLPAVEAAAQGIELLRVPAKVLAVWLTRNEAAVETSSTTTATT